MPTPEEAPTKQDRLVISALLSAPTRVWTVANLPGSFREPDEVLGILEWLITIGCVEAFWENPDAKGFESPGRRLYRLKPDAVEYAEGLLVQVPPERGLLGTFVFNGWRAGRFMYRSQRESRKMLREWSGKKVRGRRP